MNKKTKQAIEDNFETDNEEIGRLVSEDYTSGKMIKQLYLYISTTI